MGCCPLLEVTALHLMGPQDFFAHLYAILKACTIVTRYTDQTRYSLGSLGARAHECRDQRARRQMVFKKTELANPGGEVEKRLFKNDAWIQTPRRRAVASGVSALA